MRQNPELAELAARGAIFPGAIDWMRVDGSGFPLAEDAQPSLSTTPNSGIPAFLTTIVDPTITEILFAPNKAAKILGEVKKGDWLTDTALFPMVEYTGEVSSYGDHNNNGSAGVNTDFPNRQSYHYQIIKQYGEREMERAGLARIAWAAALDKAAIEVLNKYQNLTYFFGVAGLQNYGLVNDPRLNASLTPATKANGGVMWFTAGGAPNATANEVYNDIITIYTQLVNQSGSNVELEAEDSLVLAMSSSLQVAMTFTNTYGKTVEEMLRKSYPKMRFETAIQFGALSATNPQGIAGGNMVYMAAENVGGQDTGYCAFTEKLRNHRIVMEMSSFKQKATQGTFGAVLRQPFAIATMLGC